jgi:hypothetical protein
VLRHLIEGESQGPYGPSAGPDCGMTCRRYAIAAQAMALLMLPSRRTDEDQTGKRRPPSLINQKRCVTAPTSGRADGSCARTRLCLLRPAAPSPRSVRSRNPGGCRFALDLGGITAGSPGIGRGRDNHSAARARSPPSLHVAQTASLIRPPDRDRGCSAPAGVCPPGPSARLRFPRAGNDRLHPRLIGAGSRARAAGSLGCHPPHFCNQRQSV